MKFKVLKYLVISCFLLVLQGCSKKLNGDVFVLNIDGSSKKLALVDVYAIPAKNVVGFEKTTKEKYTKEKADVMSGFAAIDLKSLHEEDRVLNNQSRESLLRLVKRAQMGLYYAADPVGDVLKEKQDKNNEALNSKMVSNFNRADVVALYKKLQAITAITFYSEEVKSYLTDSSVVKAVTDSEGKFSMNLTADNVVLVAVSKDMERNTVRLWLVNFKSGEKKVTLSDANSFEKRCPTCLLSGIEKTDENLLALAAAISIFPKKNNLEDRSFEREWIFDKAKKCSFI